MCYKPFISKAEGGVSRGSLATVLTALQRCCSPYQPYKTCGFPYTALLCWLSISRALTNPTLTKAKLLFDCSASRSSRRFASTALQIEELHAQPCKSKSCTHSLANRRVARTALGGASGCVQTPSFCLAKGKGLYAMVSCAAACCTAVGFTNP